MEEVDAKQVVWMERVWISDSEYSIKISGRNEHGRWDQLE